MARKITAFLLALGMVWTTTAPAAVSFPLLPTALNSSFRQSPVQEQALTNASVIFQDHSFSRRQSLRFLVAATAAGVGHLWSQTTDLLTSGEKLNSILEKQLAAFGFSAQHIFKTDEPTQGYIVAYHPGGLSRAPKIVLLTSQSMGNTEGRAALLEIARAILPKNYISDIALVFGLENGSEAEAVKSLSSKGFRPENTWVIALGNIEVPQEGAHPRLVLTTLSSDKPPEFAGTEILFPHYRTFLPNLPASANVEKVDVHSKSSPMALAAQGYSVTMVRAPEGLPTDLRSNFIRWLLEGVERQGVLLPKSGSAEKPRAGLANPVPHTEVSHSGADILEPVFRPQRFTNSWIQLGYYALVGMGEETLFRWAALTWLPNAIHNHALGLSLGLGISLLVFFLAHPVVRWMVRAGKMGMSIHDPDYWRGLRRETRNEIKRVWLNPLHSRLLPALGLTGFYSLNSSGGVLTALIANGFIHFIWDAFFAIPVRLDPLDSKQEGKKRRLYRMAHLRESQFDRFWFSLGDGDRFGSLNKALGKSVVGFLSTPASPDVIFYNRSLFTEMRTQIKKISHHMGWKIHAGVGGDELEPEAYGPLDEVRKKFEELVKRYDAYFKGRYAFISIDKEHLGPDEIQRLKKFPGAIVLARSGRRFTLSVNMARYRRHDDKTTLLGKLQKAMRGVTPLELIDVENETRGPFTVSFGAVSLADVLVQLGLFSNREEWVDPQTHRIRPERQAEVDIWGMRMANHVLKQAKASGRNRAIVADGSRSLDTYVFDRGDIDHLRQELSRPDSEAHPRRGEDWLTGRLTYGQFQEEYNHKPTTYIYRVTVSNWLGSGEISERALHALNESVGYDQVDAAIKVLSNMLPAAFPDDSHRLIGRAPPDGFLIASNAPLVVLPPGFVTQLREKLGRVLLHGKPEHSWTDADRAFIRSVRPHLIIAKIKQEELVLLRRAAPRGLTRFDIKNPLQTLDAMAAVEFNHEMIPTALTGATREIVAGTLVLDEARLTRFFDVFMAANEGYHILTFNAEKAPALIQAFREFQERESDAARRQLSRPDERTGGAEQNSERPVFPKEQRHLEQVAARAA